MTYSFPSERIKVIWDPVDTERFRPKTISKSQVLARYGLEYRKEYFYLMILGRIAVGSRHKGYDRLLNLMHELEELSIQLLICGDGNDRSRLEARVRDEGLDDRVHFTGSIPERWLEDIYQVADVFILVSDRGEWRGEGVPLTPLEAAACGKPIIVGNQDGSQEAVLEGTNGFIVSPHDQETIKDRVMFLFAHPQEKERMGRAARQRILEHFSNQVFYQKTETLLMKIFPSNGMRKSK